MSKRQKECYLKPNKREIASLLPENIEPVINSGKLNLIEKEGEIIPGINIRLFYGHTEGQVIPFINYNGRTVIYTADFLALAAHIPIPFVMSYDINPLTSMEEKGKIMKEAIENHYIYFFEHDPKIECCTVKAGTKGAEIESVFKMDSLT